LSQIYSNFAKKINHQYTKNPIRKLALRIKQQTKSNMKLDLKLDK